MYSLAFAGLLRFDDLIRIRRSDLVFHLDHLEISIAKIKVAPYSLVQFINYLYRSATSDVILTIEII